MVIKVRPGNYYNNHISNAPKQMDPILRKMPVSRPTFGQTREKKHPFSWFAPRACIPKREVEVRGLGSLKIKKATDLLNKTSGIILNVTTRNKHMQYYFTKQNCKNNLIFLRALLIGGISQFYGFTNIILADAQQIVSTA